MIGIPPTSLLPILTAPASPEGEILDSGSSQPFLAILAAAVATTPVVTPLPVPEVQVAVGEDAALATEGEEGATLLELPGDVPAEDSDTPLPTILRGTAAPGRGVEESGNGLMRSRTADSVPPVATEDEPPSQDVTPESGVGESARGAAAGVADRAPSDALMAAARNQEIPVPAVRAAHTASMAEEPRPHVPGASAVATALTEDTRNASRPSVGGAMTAAVLAALPPVTSSSPGTSATTPSAGDLPVQLDAGVIVEELGTATNATERISAGRGVAEPEGSEGGRWEGVRSARLGGADTEPLPRTPPIANPNTARPSAVALEIEAPPVTPSAFSVRSVLAQAPEGSTLALRDAESAGSDDVSGDGSSDRSSEQQPKSTFSVGTGSDEGAIAIRTPWLAPSAVDGPERMPSVQGTQARVADLPAASAPAVTSHVTVELDSEIAGAQRVRVAIRGDVVNATVIADAAAVEALRPQLTELRQALEGHGFREAHVQLRTVGEGALIGASTGAVEGRARINTPLAQDAGSGEGSSRGRQHARDHQPPQDSGHPEYEEERP